jgi:hypothetical protein
VSHPVYLHKGYPEFGAPSADHMSLVDGENADIAYSAIQQLRKAVRLEHFGAESKYVPVPSLGVVPEGPTSLICF